MNFPDRRKFLHLATGVAVLPVMPGIAGAQAWPAKPMRVIVPSGAGSAVDVVSRLVLDRVSNQLGRPFIVENRAGAGGTLGVAVVAKAEADGYTILADIINKLHAETTKAMQTMSLREKLSILGVVPMPMTPEQFDKHINDEIASNALLVKAAGIKPE
jgi:tripartite-type tricarboxylate transporter receptor subunit TctC